MPIFVGNGGEHGRPRRQRVTSTRLSLVFFSSNLRSYDLITVASFIKLQEIKYFVRIHTMAMKTLVKEAFNVNKKLTSKMSLSVNKRKALVIGHRFIRRLRVMDGEDTIRPVKHY